MKISIDIPDQFAARALDAICARYSYDPASGMTKAAFAKSALTEFLRQVVIAYEVDIAGRTAAKDKEAQVTQELTF